MTDPQRRLFVWCTYSACWVEDETVDPARLVESRAAWLGDGLKAVLIPPPFTQETCDHAWALSGFRTPAEACECPNHRGRDAEVLYVFSPWSERWVPMDFPEEDVLHDWGPAGGDPATSTCRACGATASIGSGLEVQVVYARTRRRCPDGRRAAQRWWLAHGVRAVLLGRPPSPDQVQEACEAAWTESGLSLPDEKGRDEQGSEDGAMKERWGSALASDIALPAGLTPHERDVFLRGVRAAARCHLPPKAPGQDPRPLALLRSHLLKEAARLALGAK
jgi:hypothetical protein